MLVGPAPFRGVDLPGPVRDAAAALLAADPSLGRGQVGVVACPTAPGGRLVLAPTGDLAHWTDDVRRYGEAALLGARRALASGATRPALAVAAAAPHDAGRFERAGLVAATAALAAGWQHPQVRLGSEASPLDEILAVAGVDAAAVERANALETGRALARDLTAGDPECAAPEPFAARCERAFIGGPVQIEVQRDAQAVCAHNPLLGAVARASMAVARHQPRVVVLRYDGGPGPHFFFAGKGVTYDTGGADLKVGGAMAGMSADKGGAAAVAGLFAVLGALRPRGVRATAWLGCVRNSIGADAFVSDEILVSRAGVRVVVGNTDAEGRMVLADMLAALRPEAEAAGDDVICMSVATLTGHVIRAYGPYPSVMGNGVAVERGWPQRIAQAGAQLGEPFEVSTIRREDYEMIAPKWAGGPVVQCNSAASVNTPRGHQFPFAFLERTSGFEEPGDVGAAPLPYVHLDVAGCVTHRGGALSGLPTGVPVAALAGAVLGWEPSPSSR